MRHIKSRTVIIAAMLISLCVATAGVGTVALAQDDSQDSPAPTVAVEHPDTVAPGESFEITLSGTDTTELRTEPLDGWTITDITADPAAGTILNPSPADLPTDATTTALAVFNEAQPEASLTITVEAPEAADEYAFEAMSLNEADEEATEEFTITVAEDQPVLEVDAPDSVDTGATADITLQGQNLDTLELAELPAEWTLTAAEAAPANATTFDPPQDALPADSGDSDAWQAVFDELPVGEELTVVFTVEAPDEATTGTYTAVGTGTNNDTLAEEFDIEVGGDSEDPAAPGLVDAPTEVEPGAETAVTISAEDVVELRLQGAEGWTVTDLTADPVAGTIFNPTPGDLPEEQQADDVILAIFDSEQAEGSLTVTLAAPDVYEETAFDFTAEALNGDEQNESFSITVTEDAEPDVPDDLPDSISAELFQAVDQDDNNELSRDEIRAMITSYAQDGEVDGVAISRDEVRELITYYAQS